MTRGLAPGPFQFRAALPPHVRRRALTWAAAAAIALFGLLPLMISQPAPLQDWPNHLARQYVEAGLLAGNSFWVKFYRFGTFLVPDAAIDLGLLGLHRAGLSGPAAGSVFLAATYLLFLGGARLLARALRADGPATLMLVTLPFYSVGLFWGLVSYVLGLALMMALLAAWLALATRPLARAAVAAFGAAALLFVHIVPAVLFVLLACCFDLSALRRSAGRWRACLSGLAAGLALLTVLRLLPGDAGRDLAMHTPGAGAAAFLLRKARLFGTALLGGSVWQDGTTLACLLVCVVAVAGAARVRLAAGSALAVVMLLALVLAAPERLGTGSLLDVRLAVLPLLFGACALRLEWRGSRVRRLALAAIGGAVLLRTGVLAVEWHRAGAVFAEYQAASQVVPAGSLMMMAYGTPLETLSWQTVWSPPIQSLATQIVARGVFFPALFANPSQQPIVLRPEYRSIAQPWNLTDAAHSRASVQSIRQLCGAGYAGVFLTVLYPGSVSGWAGGALLHGGRYFLLLDACRLPV